MPRDAVSRTANVERNGGHKWVKYTFSPQEWGAKQCPVCGLVYEHADPDDSRLHDSHHNRVMQALSYNNWKKERQVIML